MNTPKPILMCTIRRLLNFKKNTEMIKPNSYYFCFCTWVYILHENISTSRLAISYFVQIGYVA
jgi:hypothetical protein